MKNILKLFSWALLLFAGTACSLDNYDAPDSGLYGSVIDAETGELVQQDIIQGTKIYFIEHGWDNPSTQQMVIKNDGTYCNSMMFAGTYSIYTDKNSNFAPVEEFELKIKGQTHYDLKVMPFIRISNAMIYLTGDKVKASFTITQTGYDNVASIALFASRQPVVGQFLNEAQLILPLGIHYTEPHSFTIDMDLNDFPALSRGKTYYFRIGALVAIGGAKYNYSPAVAIEL